MKTYAATVAASLFLVAGLNYTADPTRRWRQKSFSLEGEELRGRLLVFPRNWDDRLLRLEHLKSAQRPEVLFFGSSRVAAVDSSMFAPGLKVYVGGMVGATVQDYASIWEALRAQGKIPRYLIFYADPWMINAHSGQFRWRSLVGLYRSFLIRSGLFQGRELWKVFRLSAERFYAGLTELLNWQVLVQSLKEIFSKSRGGAVDEPLLWDPATPLPPEADALYPDGHHFVDSLPPPELEEIRASANQYANANPVFSLFRYTVDPALLAALEAILKQARESGVEAMFILPPYHRVALDGIAKRAQYRDAIPIFRAALTALSENGRRFPVCDAIDPEVPGCGETEFRDAMHALASCHRKVLKHCLGELPEWREILPKPRGAER